jgi:predicted ABC-type transport system involved in lysophospholipase L1 biosynthesis ATPase subunit
MQNLLVAQASRAFRSIASAATSVLNALGIDERLDASRTSSPSGQQQRVAIARALVNRPRLRARRRAHVQSG